MKMNLKSLRTRFETLIPPRAEHVALEKKDIEVFWKAFDSFVEELKDEYVKKLPEGVSPSERIVKAMQIGRISILEELLGEKKV